MIFFTGCTHFGHANIIDLAKRPFGCVEEMDQVLVDNWNRTVKPKDTVYHLGDFVWWKGDVRARAARFDFRLNGKIIYLRGNHDPSWHGTDYVQFNYKRVKFVLFHYPIEEWDGWYGGSVHCHCHTHETRQVTETRRYNVAPEANDYCPVPIDTVMARLGV